MDNKNGSLRIPQDHFPLFFGQRLRTVTIVSFIIGLLLAGIFFASLSKYSHPQVPTQFLPSPTIFISPTPAASDAVVENWKTFTNTKYGYQLSYPKDWSSSVPTTDQETLDSVCLGKDTHKCTLNITVLESTSWDREQKLLGLTLSSKQGTREVSFAGANGFKRVGYFGETGSSYGFVTILQSNNKVYKIWAYQKTEDQTDYTNIIDQILSTFKFIDQDQTGNTLKPADAKFPAAGVCAGPGSDNIATITLNQDTPMPRCIKVSANQQLQITNNTNETVTVTLGQMQMKINPGKIQLDNQTFGSYLAPGVHFVSTSLYGGGGPEIWLQ